jgi:hypothetical protein
LDEEMPDLDYRGTLVPAEGIRLFAQTGDPSVAEGNYHGAVWLFSDGWGAATRFYLRPDGEADASTFACVTR